MTHKPCPLKQLRQLLTLMSKGMNISRLEDVQNYSRGQNQFNPAKNIGFIQ